MIKNFLISVWRQILRQPGFYSLNILGLAIGLGSFILMYQFASYELSYDSFHKNVNDLYRVNLEYTPEGKPTYSSAAVFGGTGPAMVNDLSQVEVFTRIIPVYNDGGIIKYGDKNLRVTQMHYTENSFFELFSFNLLEGDRSVVLKDIHTAVISSALAQRLFGDEDAIGQTIRLQTVNGEVNYLINGVYQGVNNTHFKSDILLSLRSLEQAWESQFDTNWAFNDFNTYVRLTKGTDPETIEAQFTDFISRNAPPPRSKGKRGFSLIPMKNIHLDSHINQELEPNGDRQTVVFMLILSFLILFIAVVNYINFYTSKATERGKEVGVRKTLGSGKVQLRMQFMFEAFLINMLAVVLALFIVNAAAPYLSSYADIGVSLDFFNTAQFWLQLTGLWILTSTCSGFYPAMIISNFRPVDALKSIKMKSSDTLRKGIVVWQFIASAALMIGAVTVYNQLKSMNERPLGINTNDLILINIPHFTDDHDSYLQSVNGLKNELMKLSAVTDASYSSDAPGQQVGWRGTSVLMGTGSSDVSRGIVYRCVVGKDYLNTFDLNLLAGRNFLRSQERTVIINQKALEIYGFESPEEAINRDVRIVGVDTFKIVGVIENYFQESLKEPIKPTAYFQIAEEVKYLFVRVDAASREQFLDRAEVAFEHFFDNLPFEWQTMEDQLSKRHATENNFFSAFKVFVGLSIIISVFGLLGLASFATQKRQKEMSLRKVLGSSIVSVVVLFFKEFVILAVLGNILAFPIIYYLANRWLNDFSFRTEFVWWLPITVLIASVLLAFIATIYYILKVARLNPVKILNRE